MNESFSMPISRERLAEIEAIPDEAIDTSDIPEAGEDFFKRAKLGLPNEMASSTHAKAAMMITLYGFGPHFGLPDPSPFVTKAELLLKMAQLPYRTDVTGFRKAPKGKLPYIDDDGERIADSTFIRWHLERKHKIDFDRGLGASERAVAWAFEKMAEDNLYWAVVHERWMDEVNFNKGSSAA
jgi:hypothetical protein